MLWDIFQQIQINELNARVSGVQSAAGDEAGARRAAARVEERVDRLALVCRALFELLHEKTGLTEEQLSAKVLEIDLRDGVADGRMSPVPQRCPKCQAMMSPRFGRCLFCGEQSTSGPAL
jgi:hypothetical protein